LIAALRQKSNNAHAVMWIVNQKVETIKFSAKKNKLVLDMAFQNKSISTTPVESGFIE
jgi:hypothetical protein